MGKPGDKVSGATVADLCVLQDQMRASFQGIQDLQDRLDKAGKHSVWCACYTMPPCAVSSWNNRLNCATGYFAVLCRFFANGCRCNVDVCGGHDMLFLVMDSAVKSFATCCSACLLCDVVLLLHSIKQQFSANSTPKHITTDPSRSLYHFFGLQAAS